jgi:hypothetical protein
MRQLPSARAGRFRLRLAGLAFLAYAAAIIWQQDIQKSTWRVEQSGSLQVAAAYLYYGKPFGSIDGGLWDFFLKHGSSAAPSQEQPADVFLASASLRKISSGETIPTTMDGNALGHAYFATAALFLFGPHTSSLVFGFVALLGLSVLMFLLRFPDDRILAVPVLFSALTLMLLTPVATSEKWIDQSAIGGIRFFVIAGILPTLHIILELFDSGRHSAKASIYALLVVQFALLLSVIAVRMSAMYFVAAIAFAAILSVWVRRGDPSRRRVVVANIAFLIMLGVIGHFAGRLLTPDAYLNAGLSEVFWHRAFSGLGANPDWPFGNLAARMDCRPQIPEGLLPGVLDRNAHCAYVAATKKGAEGGIIYGPQYETAVRQSFFEVAKDYPEKVLETYLIYKPRLMWQTLSDSTRFELSRRMLPIIAAVAVQLAILIATIRLPAGETSKLRGICAAFAVIATFSLAPQLFAWSSVATSIDLLCYLYVGTLFVGVLVLRSISARRYAHA